MRFTSVCLIPFFITGCVGSEERSIPTTGDGIEAFDTPIIAFMREYDVPGAAYAVVKDGQLVLATGYGYADLACTEPVRPGHLFRIASVSKPITAVAALKASEDRLLDLDAPVQELLADLVPENGPVDSRFGQITTRHLLSHTSGIEEDLLLRTKEVAKKMKVENPPPPDAIASYAMRFPLGSDPGTKFHYSNTAYVFIGRILERVTGMPYEEYVRTQVLAPSGITHARINGPRRPERLEGEVEYDSRGRRDRSVFTGERYVEAAYGSLHLRGFDTSSAWVISAVDLARFGASVDGRDTFPDVLSAESFELMLTEATPPGGERRGMAWNLGWIGKGEHRVRTWDHNGGMAGTTAYICTLDNGFIYVGLLNTCDLDNPELFSDFIASFTMAIHAVDAIGWPKRDLFPRHVDEDG